jgi:hypothetical protein
MRRFMIASVVAFATLMLGSTAALAANAHVVGSPTENLSGNSLTVGAKVAGLGNTTEAADFSLIGEATVSSRCFTKSGNQPQAANKQETIDVNTTETFPVRNGSANPTFTISPLSTLECPKGQRVVIQSLTYDLDLVYQGEVLTTFSSS